MRKLAKRLVSPDSGLVCPHHWSGPDWVLTDGPAVAEVAAAANFAPDPQQELGLDVIFAVGANGLPASFAVCVVCCRQNLKTGLLKQAAIGWLAVTEEWRIVWSAHEMDTTREAHSDVANLMTETPALSRLLPRTPNAGIYDANGQERIELASGQRLRFKARTLSGGRGLSGDKVVLDEAFALKPAMVGALLPTMTARPAGQVVYASSAGKADSSVLRDVRDRGRAGSSPRLTYLEWGGEWHDCLDPSCAHPKTGAAGCALDDQALWIANNPTITTGRINIQTIADLRQELPPEEFARESLGKWEDLTADARPDLFGDGHWDAGQRVQGEDGATVDRLDGVNLTPVAIGVALSLDQEWVSIAAASVVEVLEDPNDPEAEPVERLFVAAVDRRPAAETALVDGALVGWAVAEAHRIQETYDCQVVVVSKGPSRDLRRDLEDGDVALEELSFDDYAEACSRFSLKVRRTEVIHSGDELDAAVEGGVWRTVSGRQVYDNAKSDADVSMLEAATVAAHAAELAGAFNIY